MHPAYEPVKERSDLLVAPLVVVHQLVGLVPRHLDCHAVGVVLRLVVLVFRDMVAQEHLGIRVHDLVDLHGAGLPSFPFHPCPVVQVELRPVAVPQRIAHRRHLRLVLAPVALMCRKLAVHRVIPKRLYVRGFQVAAQRFEALQRLPSFPPALTVVFLEDLAVGIDRVGTPFQRHDVSSGILRDHGGVVVADLAADKRHVPFPAVGADDPAQPVGVGREGVPVGFAQQLVQFPGCLCQGG